MYTYLYIYIYIHTHIFRKLDQLQNGVELWEQGMSESVRTTLKTLRYDPAGSSPRLRRGCRLGS